MFQVKGINIKGWEGYNHMVVTRHEDGFHFYMVYNDFDTANRVAKHINGVFMMTSEVEAI